MREILFRGKRKFNNTWTYGLTLKYMKAKDAFMLQDSDNFMFAEVFGESIGQ